MAQPLTFLHDMKFTVSFQIVVTQDIRINISQEIFTINTKLVTLNFLSLTYMDPFQGPTPISEIFSFVSFSERESHNILRLRPRLALCRNDGMPVLFEIILLWVPEEEGATDRIRLGLASLHLICVLLLHGHCLMLCSSSVSW